MNYRLLAPSFYVTRATTLVVVIGAAVLYAKLIGRESDDTQLWFVPWMEETIRVGFWKALGASFANYTPPLLYLFAVASLAASLAGPLMLVKLVCIGGILCCAVSVYQLVRFFRAPSYAALAASCFLVLPTIALNGAAWGQSDGYYTAALVACVTQVLRRRSVGMMIAFGVALSFKLQAAFLAPFLLHVCIAERVSIWKAAIPVGVYVILMTPAYLAGRPPMELVSVYFEQAMLFHSLSMNAPNFWSFAQYTHAIPYETGVAIGFVLAAAAGVAVSASALRGELERDALLELAVFSATLMPFLLPKMHDRYFFPAGVLAFALMFSVPTRRRIVVAALIELGSLGAYASYLFGLRLGAYVGAFAIAGALSAMLPILMEDLNLGRSTRPVWDNLQPGTRHRARLLRSRERVRVGGGRGRGSDQ